MSKVCRACGGVKPVSAFSRNRRTKDGFESHCRKCVGARSAAHYQKNKEKRSAQARAWLSANPGKNAAYSKKWREENPDKAKACDHAWYEANRARKLAADKGRREQNRDAFLVREQASYRKHAEGRKRRYARWARGNRGLISAYAASRRAARALRTPAWLTPRHLEEIQAFYSKAAGAKGSHVDHIVPLRGRTVSGLHVPWNLQVLPATDNLHKSNTRWPDMP